MYALSEAAVDWYGPEKSDINGFFPLSGFKEWRANKTRTGIIKKDVGIRISVSAIKYGSDVVDATGARYLCIFFVEL
jgi:hypothetical protein